MAAIDPVCGTLAVELSRLDHGLTRVAEAAEDQYQKRWACPVKVGRSEDPVGALLPTDGQLLLLPGRRSA